MAIQFKFRSSVNFDSVDIDGRPSISIADLKSKIIRLKNLDTCQNFDLVFSDARTGQDFVDDEFKISSGSCVIIKRVPAGSVPSNVVQHKLNGNVQAKDTAVVHSSHRVNIELDDFDDFGIDLYPIYKANSSISHNNTNIDALRYHKDTDRGYLEPDGSGFSEAIQGDSGHGAIGETVLPKYSKLDIAEGFGLEKPVFTKPSVHDSYIPSELKCILCNSFFVDAVIVRCCQHTFCEKCIHTVLLEKAECPMCASTKYKVEDLLPNLSIRQTVAHFLILKGDFDNAYHQSVPDEESRIEGKDVPVFSYATGRGSNQEMDHGHKSSFRRNMKTKVDGAEVGSSYPQNSGGRPEDFPLVDDCQGESQPVFGDRPGLINSSGKNQGIAGLRRQKKRDRACFMCGSLDHFIKDCPAAINPHPMYQMGVMPGYASPWHHISPFANPYGSPMAFNTLIAPEANSYWASSYGGYPVPSGFMAMGGMTAPQLGNNGEFFPGYSQLLVGANDCNRKEMISNKHTRRLNEDGGAREDNVAKKKYQHDRDGRLRDDGFLEDWESPRGREDANDERHWFDDKKQKTSRSSRDRKLNRGDGRLNSDAEDMPCSTNLQPKMRYGHHHGPSRESGGRTDGCCSPSSWNHRERFELKDFNMNRVETDWKWHTEKHHSRAEPGLEPSFSSDQKLQPCSKHKTQYTRDELTRGLPQTVNRSNESREECFHKYNGKRFVKRNYGSEF